MPLLKPRNPPRTPAPTFRCWTPLPLAFSFPVGDWQFWVATGAFVLALAWLLRGVLPIPVLSRRHRRRQTQRRATLTIEGKTPEH